VVKILVFRAISSASLASTLGSHCSEKVYFLSKGSLGRLAQLVRASGLHPEGQWFESIIAHHFLTPIRMVKKSILLLATMLLFSACNFSFDFSFGDEEDVQVETEITEEDVVLEEEVMQIGDELVSLNDDWYLYTNYDEGYSLEVPKQTEIYNCDTGENDIVSVKVLKDQNISFITTMYNFDYTSGCEMYDVMNVPEERGTPWKIVSIDISDDTELEAFGQEMYGSTCTLNDVNEDGDVLLDTGDWDSDCFINYITFFKYNEAVGKAYSFDIGQDYNFYVSTDTYPNGFDELMADSFMFLE
jgi:hypothetical protein